MKEQPLKFSCDRTNEIVVDFNGFLLKYVALVSFFLIQVNIVPTMLVTNVKLPKFRVFAVPLYIYLHSFNLIFVQIRKLFKLI